MRDYQYVHDHIQQCDCDRPENIVACLDMVAEYAASIEARLNALNSPRHEPPPHAYNHISIRHRAARDFTIEVTELLNEGWEFTAPPIVAPGVDDRSDLWMAFLRREVR